METKTFLVEGMLCKNCKMHVERGIKILDNVNDVIIDIENGQVRIEGKDINIEKIKEAVEQSGYIFIGELINAPHNSDLWLG